MADRLTLTHWYIAKEEVLTGHLELFTGDKALADPWCNLPTRTC